jgi:hypothetical protein
MALAADRDLPRSCTPRAIPFDDTIATRISRVPRTPKERTVTVTTRGRAMRGFWVGTAGVVALAGLAAAPGVAYAGTGGVAKTSSCSDLVKKYTKANQVPSGVDNPKSLSKLFKQGAQTLKGLAKSGPAELRASFKRLAAAFDTFSKLDLSNPNNLTQFSTFAVTYASDFEKIATYFAKQCKFTIPTAGTIPTT